MDFLANPVFCSATPAFHCCHLVSCGALVHVVLLAGTLLISESERLAPSLYSNRSSKVISSEQFSLEYPPSNAKCPLPNHHHINLFIFFRELTITKTIYSFDDINSRRAGILLCSLFLQHLKSDVWHRGVIQKRFGKCGVGAGGRLRSYCDCPSELLVAWMRAVAAETEMWL